MSLHHLFTCTEELNYLKPIDTTTGPTIVDAPVPGYMSKKKRRLGKKLNVSNVQKVLSEEARVHEDAAVSWARKLHGAGQSLNGKFDASDLNVDPCDNVKCTSKKRVLLKKATTKRKKKDFKRIRKIIKNDILKVQDEADLPSDLRHLLDLLKSYEAGCEILIDHHPGLLKEDEKIDLFNRLFLELEFIKVTDPPKYNRIIGALPYGNNLWRPFAHCNKYVKGVYTFRNRTKAYADSSEGAVNLYRNCFRHLIKDHSTATQGGITTVFFVYNQMEHMLGTIIPRLIVNLMVEMHKESALGGVF